MGGNSSTNALPVGHHLNNGRYRIVQILGEGGYGITYEALDQQNRQEVAIKEFFPSYALWRSPNGTDAICIEPGLERKLLHAKMRFHEEAVLLHSLKNVKEIVEVYSGFEDNKTAYYTMELLRGVDMQKQLQGHGRMYWHELSPIVMQILRALYATHQMGYIHRDITPDNIFLLSNGNVKLIDFGNARRYRESQQLTAIVKDKFAPREQYSSKGRQGPWTDIYSLCVTIYYAMTGVLPKKATERNSEADALPSLDTVAAVPPEVARAVRIGMSSDENQRYRSIADFAYALYPGQTIFKGIDQQISRQRTPEKVIQKNAAPKNHANNRQVLTCVQGVMKGFYLNLSVGQIQTFGRGHEKMVQYPEGIAGVSRNQCSVLLHKNGCVYVRDDGSSYGTAINGYKLQPGVWTPLKAGDSIRFGREVYILY